MIILFLGKEQNPAYTADSPNLETAWLYFKGQAVI